MVKAAEFCRREGGIARTRMATRIWLALFGQWSWDELPVLPPELMFVPPWLPLSIYDFSGWSRTTLVPLTIVSAYRPRRLLPFTLDELGGNTDATGLPRPPAFRWAGAFIRLDDLLHHYERRPLRRLRAAAVQAARQWLVRHQEADGSWLGVHLVSVFVLLGLSASGYPPDHPVMRKGIARLDRFAEWEESPAGPVRRMVCVSSPVWDTSLAVLALADAGLPSGHQALRRAARWLADNEISVRGDWAVRRPELAAGGWSFSFDNDNFPDCDDTAVAVMALRCVAAGEDLPVSVRAGACRRGMSWLLGMQSRDGGWASFDVDNTSGLAAKLPFCDFGEATDPPSADVTAHVVEMLAHLGVADHPQVRRAVTWLLRSQEPDGSWFGRWGCNHVYGIGAVVPALVAAGVSPSSRALRRAVHWLSRHQNRDGGWGEDMRSYRDANWRGRGESTPSQTAWALLALHAAGVGRDDTVARHGLSWLVKNQRADGTWDEPRYTGTGFPRDFYMGYPMYRQVFPVMALGRYLTRKDVKEDVTLTFAGQETTPQA
jgi:squalene-hopene/tetraprenyl-beta-curcumene cyclase